jgi:iduronate 2-sulfatase
MEQDMKPLVAIAVVLFLISAEALAADSKPNVLFIAVDDLRPELGCYGAPVVQSPNIDKLASKGLLFNRAYCQQAVCSPSRASLMTGRRPDSTKVYDLVTHFRTALPDVVTLAQHFKNNGYHAQALGKIYHGGYDDPPSWNQKSWAPGGDPMSKEVESVVKEERKKAVAAGKTAAEANHQIRGPAYANLDLPDNAFPDGKIADQAIETLNKIKDKPFFLAIGFMKPHLPFVAPKKYWDMYPKDKIKLPPNMYPPKGTPPLSLHDSGELRQYRDIPAKGALSETAALEMVHGYYAATSFMDAQLGKVLDELDKLGLRENTIVVLWGDHGWQLGEHGLWCKHTNFEVAARSPLIISVPKQKNAGAKTDALVEFVDVYPSLCELSKLPLPEGLEGTSFVPLIENPTQPWKKAAFSQYPRGKLMGYSIKTDRYRYTEWQQKDKKVNARELYDHKIDPDENTNVVDAPENKAAVEELSKMLNDGWQASRPGK